MSPSRGTLWRKKNWKDRISRGLCVHCKAKNGTKGLACKSCQDKKNEALRKSNLKLKLDTLNAYGGAICSCKNCPERKNPRLEFLTLNHINGGGTKHRASMGGQRNPGGGLTQGGYHTYRWLRDRGYPPGFNVLCWNCQWGIHINKGICPHEEK